MNAYRANQQRKSLFFSCVCKSQLFLSAFPFHEHEMVKASTMKKMGTRVSPQKRGDGPEGAKPPSKVGGEVSNTPLRVVKKPRGGYRGKLPVGAAPPPPSPEAGRKRRKRAKKAVKKIEKEKKGKEEEEEERKKKKKEYDEKKAKRAERKAAQQKQKEEENERREELDRLTEELDRREAAIAEKEEREKDRRRKEDSLKRRQDQDKGEGAPLHRDRSDPTSGTKKRGRESEEETTSPKKTKRESGESDSDEESTTRNTAETSVLANVFGTTGESGSDTEMGQAPTHGRSHLVSKESEDDDEEDRESEDEEEEERETKDDGIDDDDDDDDRRREKESEERERMRKMEIARMKDEYEEKIRVIREEVRKEREKLLGGLGASQIPRALQGRRGLGQVPAGHPSRFGMELGGQGASQIPRAPEGRRGLGQAPGIDGDTPRPWRELGDSGARQIPRALEGNPRTSHLGDIPPLRRPAAGVHNAPQPSSWDGLVQRHTLTSVDKRGPTYPRPTDGVVARLLHLHDIYLAVMNGATPALRGALLSLHLQPDAKEVVGYHTWEAMTDEELQGAVKLLILDETRKKSGGIHPGSMVATARPDLEECKNDLTKYTRSLKRYLKAAMWVANFSENGPHIPEASKLGASRLWMTGLGRASVHITRPHAAELSVDELVEEYAERPAFRELLLYGAPTPPATKTFGAAAHGQPPAPSGNIHPQRAPRFPQGQGSLPPRSSGWPTPRPRQPQHQEPPQEPPQHETPAGSNTRVCFQWQRGHCRFGER